MKRTLIFLLLAIFAFSAKSTIHEIKVWDGYYQFLPSSGLTIQLGDTIHWLPLDQPSMVHTVTSTNIPVGAASFDQIWQMPADTFFEYIPTVPGFYEYECTPHAVSYNMVGNFTVESVATSTSAATNDFPHLIQAAGGIATSLKFTHSAQAFPFQVFDLKGKLHLQSSTERVTNIEQLSSGHYFIYLQGDRKRSIRFFKQ